jgi:hypothetical protein
MSNGMDAIRNERTEIKMVGCDDKMNRYDEQIKESINK